MKAPSTVSTSLASGRRKSEDQLVGEDVSSSQMGMLAL